MNDIFPFYSIGHFINQPKNRTEFEILRFDEMEEPNIDDFHKHSFYEILWTEKGNSRQIIDYNEYVVKPNSLFFISPNQVHHFEEWKLLTGGTILFTEDFYLLNRTNKDTLFELSFLDNLYSSPCIEFTKKEFAEILELVHRIEAEQKRTDKNPSIVQAYLSILLAEVQRHIQTKKEKSISKKYLIQFKQFKTILEKHFVENKTANFYAGQLHITPHHLNLICKEIANMKATEIIRARSILEAKRLLTYSTKTISEIAFELHYTDSSYFAKTFKAITNQTPLDFKNEMSEKYRTR
ncbi:helix-turn-helix domain-containing protein [Algoriphagus sp. H41]|uniref:Helix-turn-helix domain-containing protein n=1 Tax=Algoriphagus oliviformis TaxID=2811231 RepID=A0ABS3CDK0_9BACT|nr:AraC family transcriptional regulator [Algoriphagus oliviformis]MBN7813714.1 helix-turn-helix domain-containing protein [Algoriphagus oliviformis]